MRSLLIAALLVSAGAAAQPAGANYDESKVPTYSLPDPLIFQDGHVVNGAKDWQTHRRPEIFALLESQMFGRAPGRPADMSFELMSTDKAAFDGKAVRKEIAIRTAGRVINVLLYLPAAAHGPAPVIVGLNFDGNQTVHADPGIRLSRVWIQDRKTKAITSMAADAQSRGSDAHQWQVEKILSHGYGLATVYYGDIEPDIDGAIGEGVRAAYLKGQPPAAGEWGAIAAWAWGLSRVVDYLATDSMVDSKHLAVMGHSRLGKTALWAGATDARFSLVIANDSGEGGAAISRRMFGETVKHLNTRFPHWFCANYRQYNDREESMPFDSHMLIALIAPRPVYIASAVEDQWADPRGEFLAAVAASRVWAIFGKRGIGTTEMPGLHTPVGDTVRYHIRAGKHDVTEYDWEQYLAFADRYFRK